MTLIEANVVIPATLDAFMQSDEMLTYILMLICEATPDPTENKLQLIATLADSASLNFKDVCDAVVAVMKSSPLYERGDDFPDDDVDDGQTIKVDLDSDKIVQKSADFPETIFTNAVHDSGFPDDDSVSGTQRIIVDESLGLIKQETDDLGGADLRPAADIDMQNGLKGGVQMGDQPSTQQANAQFQRPDNAMTENSALQNSVMNSRASEPSDIRIRTRKTADCDFSEPELLQADDVYKQFFMRFEKFHGAKIDPQKFDFQQMKQNFDVDGLQKLYQEQEAEYSALYAENAALKAKVQEMQQKERQTDAETAKFCRAAKIQPGSIAEVLGDAAEIIKQNGKTLQQVVNSPQQIDQLNQQLQFSQKIYRTKELELVEVIDKQKTQLQKAQNEKQRLEIQINEQKKIIEGLQMRINAQKRVTQDQFGLEKMRREAQQLMIKAEKMGYK